MYASTGRSAALVAYLCAHNADVNALCQVSDGVEFPIFVLMNVCAMPSWWHRAGIA